MRNEINEIFMKWQKYIVDSEEKREFMEDLQKLVNQTQLEERFPNA